VTPIERAAKALADNNWHPSAYDGDPEAWRVWIGDVRLVLFALREPSEAVLDAGLLEIYGCIEQGEPGLTAHAGWQAMIDAILADS
jgi:hypothetical protein